MQLAFAAQMRELDRQTIEEIGIPGMVLMENAGRGTVVQMERHFGPVAGKTVCVFVGPGNNGGDGLVIARTVHGLGAHPLVFFLFDPEQLVGDAGRNFILYKKLNLPYLLLDTQEKIRELSEKIPRLHVEHPLHCLVDALFGTGLVRELSGHVADAVHILNQLRIRHQFPILSVDMPSGLDSDTGAVLGCAVQADCTVSFCLAKPGHFHHGGTAVGRLERIDIGIPSTLIQRMGLQGRLLDESFIATHIRPKNRTAHKGTNGHLLILAGSAGKTGAALLCAQAALRGGVGLVSCAVPQPLNTILATALAEAMTVPLPASHDCLAIEDYDQIIECAEGKQALVLGPGLGTDDTTAQVILRLYRENTSPQVIDADALNILAQHPDILRKPAGPRIFTPHPGEMARLLDTSINAVQADRLKAAQWLHNEADAKKWPAMITVLKGAGTVVAATDGAWAINATGNPGMATGGMGDVLAGLIGSLLAQGYSPWDAACLGVCLHGLAADQLAVERPLGYTASEVAAVLPEVMGKQTSAPTPLASIPAKESYVTGFAAAL
jgi:hydroxyethylthiazole kinase-like uncharacterized protein yjeF